jgi:hypothetical protein
MEAKRSLLKRQLEEGDHDRTEVTQVGSWDHDVVVEASDGGREKMSAEEVAVKVLEYLRQEKWLDEDVEDKRKDTVDSVVVVGDDDEGCVVGEDGDDQEKSEDTDLNRKDSPLN